MKKLGYLDLFKSQSHLSRQALSTIPSCLLSICSGMTFGITAVMLPQLRVDKTIQYDAAHESWIASIGALSMILGSLGSGYILDHVGRRMAHIISGLPYVIGWVTIACAPSTAIIILGRFLTGIAAGGNKPVVLVYVGEIASPRIRTRVLIITGILMNVGTLLSHTFGYYLNWKISSYLCVVVAVMITVSSLFLKESPLWLIAKGKTGEGIENFRWFRGTDDASEAELKAVLESQSQKPKMTAKEMYNVVCSSAFIKPMLLLLVIAVNIQFAGEKAIGFYSQDIFEQMFSGKVDPFVMMIAMDCIVSITSVVVCFFGKYVSKKKTFLASNLGVSLTTTGLVACLIFDSDSILWVTVLMLIIFLCFSTTISTLGWTFVPEVLPNSARGLGSGINSIYYSLSVFAIVKPTPDIIKSCGVSVVFAIFGVFTFICGIIVFFILPDTDGKTLQSIEDGYNEKNVKCDASEV